MMSKGQKFKSIATEDNFLSVSLVELRVHTKAHTDINILWQKYQVNFYDFAAFDKKQCHICNKFSMNI